MTCYKLRVLISRQVRVESRELDRDAFYSWIWENYSASGLQGVHEGTILSEQAAQRGFETDSWTVDAGETPATRDWVSAQEQADVELYFADQAAAEAVSAKLKTLPGIVIAGIQEQEEEDWDAQWKASFKGIQVPPFWHVLPPWEEFKPGRDSSGPEVPALLLRINPGAGFGTGTHETTQLCLEQVAQAHLCSSLQGRRVLDFGSGSGILAIGAALLGAQIDAVEIDPLAIENAEENARLNSVEGRISCSRTIGAAHGPYRMVIANILKPVLLEFAERLVARLDLPGKTEAGTDGRPAPRAELILSGLIEKDVAEVSTCFGQMLRDRGVKAVQPEVRALQEWRALVWKFV